MLCQVARGICCKCEQPNCENWHHITCAQKANCLVEFEEKENKIAFLTYCIEHKPVDELSRRLSSMFVHEMLSDESQQHQLDESFANNGANGYSSNNASNASTENSSASENSTEDTKNVGENVNGTSTDENVNNTDDTPDKYANDHSRDSNASTVSDGSKHASDQEAGNSDDSINANRNF